MANKNNLKATETSDKKRKSVIKKSFISGLLVILPIWLTILIIWYVFKWISSLSMPILSPFLNIFTSDSQWIDILAKIASFFLTLIIIFFVGFFTNIWFGKKLYSFFENVLTKIPLIGSIYFALKKLFSFLVSSIVRLLLPIFSTLPRLFVGLFLFIAKSICSLVIPISRHNA